MTISARDNRETDLTGSQVDLSCTGDYPWKRCIHHLFEAQVERTPQHRAIICENQELTYQELNMQANQLAHYLRTMGVGPEVPVGLYMERSTDMIIGLFGIFKAGGTYIPLDPALPAERLALLLEDTQTAVLITQHNLLETLPAHHVRLVCLDRERDLITQQSEENPDSGVKGEHLAYIIYTSGSTGLPKGVLIEHHALATHCLAMVEAQELTVDDGAIAFSPLSFDASLEQTLPALLVGARVLVCGRDMWTPAELLCQIKKDRLTVVSLPIAFWHQAIAEWAVDPQQLVDHPLRLLIAGGDRFPVELARLWREIPLRSARFFNVYGPTEATITSAMYELPRDGSAVQMEESIPLGRPFLNHTAHILDDAGQPAAVGVVGELHIGGALLARGYLNRPDLTAERFIPDPFRQCSGARLYKTGDLACYRSDGILEFFGRIDQQVKIRGIRIEVGEIEATLSQHPSVRQAVVIAREDRPGDKCLVAYLVLHKGLSATSEELRSQVIRTLPAYMLPTAFVFLDTLPLTPHGKVDRRVLAALEAGRSVVQTNYVAPILPVHHQLVQIWEDLLQVRPIGVTDDFFELGGHSLLAARLIDRIERVCGVRLPISTLYTGATIEYLARVLTGEQSANDMDQLIAVQTDGSRHPFFYLHGQLEDGSAFHCYSLARALGPEQPFYGLPPHPLDAQQGLPTLEEIAAAHLNIVRGIQPTGPYMLGGCCNGGLVVYEMARQLRAAGEVVDLLVLIDPVFLVYPVAYRWYRAVFDRLGKIFHLNAASQLTWALRLKYLARRALLLLKRENNEEPLALRDLEQDYFRLYDWIALGYRPDSLYDGKVTFFWAQEGYEALTFPAGWRTVETKGQVEVHRIPGSHITCRTEYLPILAERLADCIQQVRETEPAKARSSDRH